MAEVGGITVKLALENSSFQRGMQDANRQIRLANSEFKNAVAGTDDYGKGLDGVEAKAEKLTKQIEAQSKIVELNKEAYSKSKTTLEDNVKSQEELKRKVEDSKRAYEESKKTLGENAEETKKLKSSYQDLSQEYTENEEKIRNNVRTMENAENRMNTTEARLKNMQHELKNTNDELEKQSSKWTQYGEKLEVTGKKLEKLGSKMESAGKSLTTKLTLPIVGIGVAGAKASTDLNKAMATVSTMIPGQSERLLELKKGVQDISIDVAKGTDEIADSTYGVISAYGDTSDTMEKVKLNAMGATAGVASTGDALDLTSAIMKGFGDTSAEANKKVLDLSFETLKLGQTSFPELASSMGKVVPQTNELKISQEELFAVFATGTGVTGNASEVSTQYQGVLKAMMAPTKDMAGLMKELGVANGNAMIEQYGLMGSIEEIVNSSKKSGKPLQKYIGSIRGQTLALALAGEQSDVYKEKLGKLQDSEGAMESAFKEQTEGINKTGFTFEQAMAKMRVAAQKLGDAMGPMLAKGADMLSNLADKLSNLNEEQLDTIINTGKTLASIGPVLLIGGKAIKGVGRLSIGLGLASKAFAGLEVGATLSSAAMTALPFVGVVAGLGAVAFGAKKFGGHMGKSALEVDLFKGELDVSEETQEAVNDFMELENGANVALKEMAFTGGTVTDEMKEKIGGNFAEMKDTIVNASIEQKDETLEHMRELFAESDEISQVQAANMINDTEKQFDAQVEKTEQGEAKIQEILNQANEEKRELKNWEKRQIDRINREMKEDAVKVLSASETEQMIIMENIKNNSSELSAIQAAEVVKNSAEQRDGRIKEAEEEYKESMRIAMQLKSDGTDESIEAANNIIAEAERKKKETVKEAKEMHKDIVEEAKKQSEEHINEVNWETGELKSKWEVAKDDIVSTVESMGKDIKKDWEQTGKDLSRIWGNIKTSAKTSWEEQKKETVKVVKQTVSDVKNNWTNNYNKFRKVASEAGQKFAEGLESKKQLISSKANDIKNSVLDKWKTAKEAESIGRNLVEGFQRGIQFTKALAKKATEVASKTLAAMRTRLDTHSPSKETEKIGKDVNKGLEVGLDKSTKDVEKKAKEVAESTLKAMETEFKDAEMTVPETVLKSQTNTALSGKNKNYSKFVSKLKADELEETKKMLESDYKARERALNKKINNLDSKKNKKQIEQTKKQKEALRERNENVKQILDDRLDIVNEKMNKEANIFTDKMTQYDESIKRLSKTTDDLSEELINNNAIMILQKQRVSELKTQHEKISKQFGSTSTEAIKLKKSLEEAKTEYEKYGDSIVATEEKIRQSKIDLVNDTTDRVKQALAKQYQEQQSIMEDNIQKEIENLNKWETESKKSINNVYDSKIERAKESSEKAIQALQDEIDAIDNMQKEEEREDIDKAELKEIAGLEDSLLFEHDEYNKLEIQKRIDKLKKDRAERLKKQELNDKKLALKEEISDIQEKTNKEVEILEDKRKSEIESIDLITEYERENLSQRLESVKTFYDNKLKDSMLQAEAEKMVMDNNQKEIVKLLHSYEEDYQQAGQSLGEKFAEGFEEKIAGIQGTIDSLNAQINTARNEAIREMSNNVQNNNTTNNKSNTVNIYSDKKLDHYGVQRETENTLRRMALGGA